MLFDIIPKEENIKKICENYLQGLEWVFKYYTNDCPDWNWKYNYSYPPLLNDLIKYIPDKCFEFIINNNSVPVEPETQLAYVLPYDNLHLLENYESFIENYCHLYTLKNKYKWSFCRYFWECHPILPDFDIKCLYYNE